MRSTAKVRDAPDSARNPRKAATAPPEKTPAKSGLTTLNRLRCFEMVVLESGFKRATLKLHITQPALSYQMKHLEEELGVQLFHRRPGGVSLTEAGQLLFTHVQRVSGAVRQAELAVKELPATGEVRIGTVNSIGTYFLPKVLGALRERHAEARPVLYRARSDEHIEALLANQVDLAILADPRVDRRLHYETLFEERVSLVVGRAHPLFGADSVRPEQLQGTPFVSLSEQTPTGALVGKYLHRIGLQVETVVSSDDIETVKRMAEMGMGAAFLPDMVVGRDVVSKDNPAGRLGRVGLDPALTRRVTLVGWGGVPASLAVAAFVAEVRRVSGAWPGAIATSQG